MMRKNLPYRFGLAGCLVLAAAWVAFTVPELGNAAKAGPRPPKDKETIFFEVTTLEGSDIVIKGYFDSEGTSTTFTGCKYFPLPAAGRADKRQVIMNRPSPAIQMDFLAELSCFRAGDIYDLGCRSTMVIKQAKNGSASIIFFFGADGINGEVLGYRVDGDAIIVPDDGGSFPKGDSGYTVFVDNIRVSQDTGPRRNACEGSFPNAMAVIRLDRIP